VPLRSCTFFDGWYYLSHYLFQRYAYTASTTTHRRRSLSESILMLTRSPESVSGDRQILAERRELPVDEPAAASAFRASTSSSRSERHTFQLENTTVQTSAATINTTTTRKARRVLLRAQNVVHEQDARIPFDGTTDDSPNMVTYQHFSSYVQLRLDVQSVVIRW